MAQVSLQELRTYWGTTFNTNYVPGDNAAWATTNTTKLRIISIDKSGLKQDGIEDTSVQTRLHGAPPPFQGLRDGSLKVSTWLGGATTSATADAYAVMLGKMMGGLVSPPGKTVTIGSGSTTTNVVGVCTNVNTNGLGVLINGEARIATNVQSGWMTLNMALSRAPTAGESATVAHAAHFTDSETVNYCDWMAIGKSTTDQQQGIGCQASFSISGIAPGEAPKLEVTLQCADHQTVPADERASLLPGTAPSGSSPPTGKNFGGFFIADAGSEVARATMRAGKFAVNPGIGWTKLEGPNGVNGIEGWLRNPSKPTFEFTCAIDEDHLGLIADFENQTAKQAILQLGTAAGKCVMIYFPKFYLDRRPIPEALNNEQGLKCSGHGDDNYTTDGELKSSSCSIHVF